MNIQLNEAYKILGIDNKATLEEVHRAYSKIIKECHFDQVGEEEKIKSIIEAYNVIIKFLDNKKIDIIEIRKTQAAARAKAQAKAREQERREENKRKALKEEKIRKMKKIYSDLIQAKEFKKFSITEEYFISHIEEAECAKWVTIHRYANIIYARRERYIKEYEDFVDSNSKELDSIVSFTTLHPNPISQGKKKTYKIMINQKYSTIGEAINTVYKIFSLDINNLSKCLEFNDDSCISYLIGDEAYQARIYKMAENKLTSFYKIVKFIVSKPECYKEIDEIEFLNVNSNKYRADIIRMKNIELYVNRVYVFRDDGTIAINNQNITRTEYQHAREWLGVVKTNNLGKVDRLAIIIYINYVAGCLQFIYDKIPLPEFNPNVSPEKLLDVAKVINSLEKYYILAQKDGITDCFNTYIKMKNNVLFKGKNLSTILEELLKYNGIRKVINKYYLHSYYSLEEIAKMKEEEHNDLYNRALEFEKEINDYLASRKENSDLVELYLKKLKDNKKFAPLFSNDVSFMEIMSFLELKKVELDEIRVKEKPLLSTYIFMSDKELTDLKEAPIYEEKKKFIVSHKKSNEADDNINLDKMSRKQVNQLYRDTVISFLNNNHPKYKDNNLNSASFGRLNSEIVNSLVNEAEDEIVKRNIIRIINSGDYGITEKDVTNYTPEERKRLLNELAKKRTSKIVVSSPYTN